MNTVGSLVELSNEEGNVLYHFVFDNEIADNLHSWFLFFFLALKFEALTL